MKPTKLIPLLSLSLLPIAAAEVNKTEKGKPPPIPTESITNLDSLISRFPVCIYDCTFDYILAIAKQLTPQCKLLTGANDEKPDWKCFCEFESVDDTVANNRTIEAAAKEFGTCFQEVVSDCSKAETENLEFYFDNLNGYCSNLLSGSGSTKPPTASRSPNFGAVANLSLSGSKNSTEKEDTKSKEDTGAGEKKDKTSDATIVGLTGSYGLTSVVVLGFFGALTFLV